MAAPSKDTVYIDIDDEITAIIDKVRSNNAKILALVLPKRATVLQSIVNMRLLKRAADDARKHLVLITSETGLLPLAGAAGLYVAKTLSSKPEIPAAPGTTQPVDVDEDDEVNELPAAATVGTLAGLGAASAVAASTADDVETLEIDNADEVKPDGDAKKVAVAAGAAAAVKKDKKLHVPNFERFRLVLALGILGVILLGVGLYYALAIAPKATIAVQTDSSLVNVNLDMRLNTKLTALNTSTNTVPAKLAQQQKTYNQQVPATGQKNNGEKASGAVLVSLNGCSKDTVTIPKGTGVSGNGKTYITQASVTLNSITKGGKCNPSEFASEYSSSIDVIASNAGAEYNLGTSTTMAVAASSGYKSSDLKASADGDITGGTDNITKVVSQGDVDGAKAKLATSDTTVKRSIINSLKEDGYVPIETTYNQGAPSVSSNVNVGDPADNVTVTATVTYSMFGAKQTDLKTLVDKAIRKQIDDKQNILTDGINSANYDVQSTTDTTAAIAFTTTATAGPDLNKDEILKMAAGKKPADVKGQLNSNPDVTSVEVKLSPFWVSSIPKKTDKITVTIADPKPANNK